MGKLIWIASYPKSGTTWLRAFLHNYVAQSVTPYDINRLMDLSTGESAASRYRIHDRRPASRYSIAEVQRMRPLVHREIAAGHPGLAFVKTHNASVLVEGVPLVTPEVTAGAIYLVRDPRAVAVSYSHHLARSIDETIEFMADPEATIGGTDQAVFQRLSSWSTHVHFWTRSAHPHLHVVRYEEMVLAPLDIFPEIIRFLGEAPPPDRLARAIRFSAFEVLSAQEREKGFVERPGNATAPFFHAGKPDRWRVVLTARQQARIERDHAVMMERFGYL